MTDEVFLGIIAAASIAFNVGLAGYVQKLKIQVWDLAYMMREKESTLAAYKNVIDSDRRQDLLDKLRHARSMGGFVDDGKSHSANKLDRVIKMMGEDDA